MLNQEEEPMRIETFLKESPMFCIALTARRFDSLTTQLLKADGLNFLEALILSTLFFESPAAVKPSQLAETFETTRGNVSHCISSLEAKGFVQRKIPFIPIRTDQAVTARISKGILCRNRICVGIEP